MTQTPPPSKGPMTARDARLKAALKANMAKRKAQARARTADPKPHSEPHTELGPDAQNPSPAQTEEEI